MSNRYLEPCVGEASGLGEGSGSGRGDGSGLELGWE